MRGWGHYDSARYTPVRDRSATPELTWTTRWVVVSLRKQVTRKLRGYGDNCCYPLFSSPEHLLRGCAHAFIPSLVLAYKIIYSWFNDVVVSANYTVSNNRVTGERYIGKDVEGRRRFIFKCIIPAFAGKDWINHENPVRIARQSFELGTSKMKCSGVNHLVACIKYLVGFRRSWTSWVYLSIAFSII